MHKKVGGIVNPTGSSRKGKSFTTYAAQQLEHNEDETMEMKQKSKQIENITQLIYIREK